MSNESKPPPYKSEEDEDKTTYVKLISAEGHEFLIQRNIALAANTIRTMLTSNFRESEENLIRFPDIPAHILEDVIKYLHYKVKYSYSSTRIPEFEIKPEKALELLMAASYIDC